MRRTIGNTVIVVACIALIVVALFPVLWMLLSSFKTDADIFSLPPKWLFVPTGRNYAHVVGEMGMGPALLQSVIVALGTTALAVVLGVPAGYAIARFAFRGRRDVWFWFISNFMMIPVVLVIPYFVIAGILRLIDSPIVLILVYQTFAIPLVMWMSADQFRSISKQIEEAAMIDGASRFAVFTRIAIPLASPGIAVGAIFALIFSWNELLYALILMPRPDARTAPITAISFLGGYSIPWGDVMAAGTLIAAPILVFALIFSRYLVRGLTLGAVK